MYMPLRSPDVTDDQRAEADEFVSYLFRADSPALRDAYQAAADTVTREMDEPELTGTGRRDSRPRTSSRAPVIRLTAPLAAAASVVVIALAMSVIATSGPGGKPNHPPAGWRLSPATSVA
jgi:plasmid stabilization system protein ParE